jgi:hypothetical protein
MALTVAEKERIRYHLGYPAIDPSATVSRGNPSFYVEYAMEKVRVEAEPRLRSIVATMDSIESFLVTAQERLVVDQLGDIKLRGPQTGGVETDLLDKEYVRWGMRLAETLGCPVFSGSHRYMRATRGLNVPVRR